MLPRMRTIFGFESRARRRDRLTQRFRPRVEALEERLTPNTYTPTTTTDFPVSGVGISVLSATGMIVGGAGTGQVTLRSAVVAANANGGSNTITFPGGVNTYTLTIAPVLTNNGGVTDKTTHDATTGSLDVTGALTVTGNGAANTIIQAGTTSSNGIDQLFDINPTFTPNGFAVSITDVTLQNGKNASNDQGADGEGGAIAFDASSTNNAGSLTLTNDVITHNQTTNGDGGALALFDGGTVSISNCTLSSNTANATGSNAVQGGAIFAGFSSSVGTLTLSNNTIIDSNKVVATASGSSGGGIDTSNGGLALTIHGGQIISNQAPGDGGGINAARFTIDQGTLIDDNTSTGGKGGGIAGGISTATSSITNATITSNGAKSGGGGVFFNNGTSNTISGSRFVGNTSTSGATGVDTDFAGNSATATANGNWWGTNNGPSTFVGAHVTAANWLGLVLTPGSGTIGTNSSTGLAAKFVSTTTSTPPSGGAAVTGTALDGLNVTFGTGPSPISGTSVSPTSVAISSGAASSTFFSGSSFGTAHPSVALDSQAITTTITIVGAPTANGQSVNVGHNTAKGITLTASDPNSPPRSLTYTVTTNPTHGVLSGTAPNLTYTPNAGYYGSDSFQFKANNGVSDSNTATVSINVDADKPTANSQSVSTKQNTAVGITLTATDGDDSPPRSLTYTVTTNPTNGVLSGTAPNLTYTPNAGYFGPDSFQFKANNGEFDSNIATVSITVVGAPTANNQSVMTNQDTAKAIQLTGSDPNSPPRSLTYTITANPTNGSLSGFSSSTGAVTYTPNPGYFGSDSFQFKVNNGTLDSNIATVSITVNQATGQATVSSATVGWGSLTSGTLVTQGDGLRLLPEGRTTDLPWLNISKINITLSSAATLSPGDVTVTGITVANYGPVTISGSGTNYTITLAQPIAKADRVTVTIGNANITTYTRRLDVLPGDFLDKGAVDSANMLAVYYATARPYNIFADINGDGVVDINDVTATRNRIGTRLP